MKTVTGDLIELAKAGRFDIIIHGCNCFCKMGKGIAKQISTNFPRAKIYDNYTTTGDASKLGKISVARDYNVLWERKSDLYIVNAYIQYDYRGTGIKVDYQALRDAFIQVKALRAKNFPNGAKIGYPKIGAGLAGGDWETISAIIDEVLEGEDHTLVILP